MTKSCRGPSIVMRLNTCVLSFAESSFFPIPPDVMLAPMALAQPDKAFRFALLTTIASVLGGVYGYEIGYFLFDRIEP